MSKFKARFQYEHEILVDAPNVEAAAAYARAQMERTPGGRLLGVIPVTQEWPDREAVEEQPFKRPPRNTPPSGSPGTPTVGKAPEFVQAVAA